MDGEGLGRAAASESALLLPSQWTNCPLLGGLRHRPGNCWAPALKDTVMVLPLCLVPEWLLCDPCWGLGHCRGATRS